MSGSDRTPWKTATVLDQSFLDACSDNLMCALEMICEIELPGGGKVYASDRNKYVGDRFYEALLNFPSIEQTIGEWLENEFEFSTVTLQLSNVDGRFNDYMPSGTAFSSWIGKTVVVKLGLRDVASTYRTIFAGKITDIGGIGRTTKTIVIISRDQNDVLNTQFPQTTFEKTTYPYLENSVEGLCVPFVLGNWTTQVQSICPIQAFVVNGMDPFVSQAHTNNVKCVISVNEQRAFNGGKLFLRRSGDLIQVAVGDLRNVAPDLRSFEIKQQSIPWMPGGLQYEFELGDEFFCASIGKLDAANLYENNAVSQAKKIIEYYLPGAVTFHSSWTTYADKNTPTQSAIYTIKSRVWIQQPQSIISYVKSLLQQVRLECFFNEANELEISPMHYEDWNSAPAFNIKNWDVERDSFKTAIDERTIFNRARATYNFEPIYEENASTTRFYKSTTSIAQLGKTISKEIVFPNLYVASQVEAQLQEILRLSIATPENVEFVATWRLLLQGLADFFALDVRIGASQFSDVPCRIRSIGFDPVGLKIVVKATSFQMFPFGVWNPGYTGIVGGQSATIVAE
jgi:hypothetical protein